MISGIVSALAKDPVTGCCTGAITMRGRERGRASASLAVGVARGRYPIGGLSSSREISCRVTASVYTSELRPAPIER